MEFVGQNRNIELVTTERRIIYLVSKPNYHTTTFSIENLLAMRNEKTQILMNTPVYLGLSILDLSINVKHKFSYDYVKPKYG